MHYLTFSFFNVICLHSKQQLNHLNQLQISRFLFTRSLAAVHVGIASIILDKCNVLFPIRDLQSSERLKYSQCVFVQPLDAIANRREMAKQMALQPHLLSLRRLDGLIFVYVCKVARSQGLSQIGFPSAASSA